MSKFKTDIPIDVEELKKLLPPNHHFTKILFNEDQSAVELHWEHDQMVTPFDFAMSFPVELLKRQQLPKGARMAEEIHREKRQTVEKELEAQRRRAQQQSLDAVAAELPEGVELDPEAAAFIQDMKARAKKPEAPAIITPEPLGEAGHTLTDAGEPQNAPQGPIVRTPEPKATASARASRVKAKAD